MSYRPLQIGTRFFQRLFQQLGMVQNRYLQVVVATSQNNGIGYQNSLPWQLNNELKYFKDLTSHAASTQQKNYIIMGRKTYQSIGRPLPGRINVVLTSEKAKLKDQIASQLPAEKANQVLVYSSLEDALQQVQWTSSKVFIIGGAELFKRTMSSNDCAAIHITKIHDEFKTDTFLDNFNDGDYQLWYASRPKYELDRKNQKRVRYSHMCYIRKEFSQSVADFMPLPSIQKHEEYQYLNLVRRILEEGVSKDDRTGTGTYSLFGEQMRFNLRHSFPLLTTKRVFWKGVVEELIWFLRGSTDAKELSSKGVNIWDQNGSREFLDSRGLDYEEGDLGPVYGFQWRHFGAEYKGRNADYTGEGVDQLAEVIRKIKETPNDRRIILTAWNPVALDQMALPPCHMTCQFWVADGELSCQLYQRSCDMGLGVPFNIASYALLTKILAHAAGLKAGDFIHTLGDAHVYKNHVEALEQQLTRTPRCFPTLNISAAPGTAPEDLSMEDVQLFDYTPYPRLAMKMAV